MFSHKVVPRCNFHGSDVIRDQSTFPMSNHPEKWNQGCQYNSYGGRRGKKDKLVPV